MPTLTSIEARNRFTELLDRVASGEEIVITRHDKPVARMVPEGMPSLDTVRQSVAGLEALQQQILRRTKGRTKLTDAEVRSAIEEGRA